MTEAIMPLHSMYIAIVFSEADWIRVEGVLRASVLPAARKETVAELNKYVSFSTGHAISATKEEICIVLDRVLRQGAPFQKTIGDLLLKPQSDEGYEQLDALPKNAQERENPDTKTKIAKIKKANARDYDSIAINKTQDKRRVSYTRVYERTTEALEREGVHWDFLWDLWENIEYIKRNIEQVKLSLPSSDGAGGDPYLNDLLERLQVIHSGIKADNAKICGVNRFIISILSTLKSKNESLDSPHGRIDTVPMSSYFTGCLNEKTLGSRLHDIRELRKVCPSGPLSKHGWTYEGPPYEDFDFN